MTDDRQKLPSLARRVLLVGLDAADWGLIDPLLAQGRMPNLACTIEHGKRAVLAAPPPLLSPILWTSIATGRRPQRHGIHGHFQPWRNGRGVSAVLASTRDAPAAWNLLAAAQSGGRSHVIGWPVSHPAESAGGVMVSDRFALPFAYGVPIADEEHREAIQPPEKRAALMDLVFRPHHVDSALLREIVPDVDDIDRASDNRPDSVAGVLAEAETICAAAEYVMSHETPWDLTAVFLPGIERLSRMFMEFHPPRRAAVEQRLFERYHQVVTKGYEYCDRLLGRLIRSAGHDATVFVISDHGFHHDARRPSTSAAATRPSHEVMALTWHRSEGIVVLTGPGAAEARLENPSVFDVTPTLLALLGAPQAETDGRSWVQGTPPQVASAIDPQAAPVQRGRSRARLRSSRGWRDAAERASDEAIRHLLELGYAEPPDAQTEQEVERCRCGNALNLARSLMETAEYEAAVRLLQFWVRRRPNDLAAEALLSAALGGAGRTDEARRLRNALGGQLATKPQI